MKVIKFSEFLSENFNDSPETFVANALQKLKIKIDSFFDERGEKATQEQNPSKSIKRVSDTIKQKKESGEKISLKELGVNLEDSQISKYSKTGESLTVWFSDPEGTYRLYVMVNLEDAVPKDNTKEFTDKDIKKVFVRFKKYNFEDQYVGEVTKNTNIKDIDQEFLIDLKIKVDKEYSGGEEGEGLEFETE
jgi:hypothetical protein